MSDDLSHAAVEYINRVDDKQIPAMLTEILEHMAAAKTREDRMWRRVPRNLIARIEGVLNRQLARITELEAWQREVALGIGYGQEWHGMYEIAPSALIVERFNEAVSERQEAEEKLAAAQATIAAALAQMGSTPFGAGVYGPTTSLVRRTYDILADTSTSAFDRATREAKAEALEVTDARTEVAARALFEAGGLDEGDHSWAEVARDDPSRAEIWRNDARQVLDAIRAKAIREGGDTE